MAKDRGFRLSPLLEEWATLAVSVLVTLAGGVYNRFPLVYYDTGTYLKSALLLKVPKDRPVFYGLWIRLARDFWNSLWSIPVAQAVLLVLLAHFLVKALGNDGRRGRFLLVSALGLLTASTGMPWFAGQLMPDIFTGILAISFFLLVWGPREAGPLERIIVPAAFFVANLVHFSHLALSLGLVAVVFALSVAFRGSRSARPIRRRLLAPALLIGLAVSTIPLVNYALEGRASFSEAGHVFLMDRLIDDRIIDRLLVEHCVEKAYVLCPYREELRTLSGNDYLWAPDSVLRRIGGFRGSRAGTWEMILDSIRYYPGAQLGSVLLHSWRQFTTFDSGDGLRSYPETKFVHRFIVSDLPGDFPAFQASRQQSGNLERQVRSLSPWESLLAGLCLGFGFLAWARILLRRIRGEDVNPGPAMTWLGVSLLVCVLNAIVCGTLSGLNARYQNRVVWLVVLACYLLLFESGGESFASAPPVAPGVTGGSARGAEGPK